MNPEILIVDDEEDILDFLEGILQHKYRIQKASNGKEAIEILDRESIHLIISDVMMPEIDGFELCRIIKSNVEYSHIPLILLTAKNSIQSKVEGLELGADAYIEKPFSKEHLIAQIHSLLANRNMIRTFFASTPLAHLKTIAHNKTDETFLNTLNNIIIDNIEDQDLDVEKLARLLNMSRITLYRKISAVSDLTPLELITITRLKKAAELLAQGNLKIYEIADMVGFSSQSHFARNFHKQFNMTPTEYMQSRQK